LDRPQTLTINNEFATAIPMYFARSDIFKADKFPEKIGEMEIGLGNMSE
jgi:hypothetical protein